ncbi:AraC family transcriptional regulator [Pseudomonas sp. efr-133-TYG-103a]|uniref:AraC family transcriptional regulator n=1 Tax=Pseudomonas sp. efr-133-TYG-103a TaxID=3040308 RepID=UPI002553A870|nr:AraC family transcriptional regulator [Pseudomonas sp. efr-133-TYG-103a]
MDQITELRDLISRHAVYPDYHQAFPCLMVARRTQPTPITGYTAEPIFALLAQGTKRVAWGDTLREYTSGEYFIAGIEMPVIGYVIEASESEPFLGIGLRLDRKTIARLMVESGIKLQSQTGPAIAVSRAKPDLIDAIIRMLRLLDNPGDLPILGPAIEREVFWRIMNCEQGAMVRQLGCADSRLTQVTRAVQWIREHYEKPLRIEDIAQVASMSVNTFFRHFKAATSLTPIQYQKHVRLHQARIILMGVSGDVAAAGYAVGYQSPSQFSRDYRKLFGHPPGEDLANLARG